MRGPTDSPHSVRPSHVATGYARELSDRIAFVGTYVPRRCGIATFTADLLHSMAQEAPRAHFTAVAVNDTEEGYRYPAEVEFEIQQQRLGDYRLAAEFLNMNRVRVVNLQHEYGIYGGEQGAHVLQLARDLRMPLVSTLHTIPREPSDEQRRVLEVLVEISDRVVVMSQTGRRFLEEIYGVSPEKIEHVHHGVPDLPFSDPAFYKDQFGVEGRRVILTFGLLSPGKGIETMIRALPQIVRRHPDVIYIVLGATHPHVKRVQGEAYRLALQQLARDLGVDRHVMFQNRYVELTELCEFLGAADIYVTPYPKEDQIVSGTLAYALAAGKAVVSTPYWYAKDMLAEGRGRLVPFQDPDALARTIVELLADDVQRDAMRKRAYTFARSMVWREVARRYLEIFHTIEEEQRRRPRVALRPATVSQRLVLPEISFAHLQRMTDDVGLIQHATYIVPNRHEGYATDDNARAVLVTLAARDHFPDPTVADELRLRYLAFLDHAFEGRRGAFHNYLGYDREWKDEEGSEDCQGRAAWALGAVVAKAPREGERALAATLLQQALARVEALQSPRAMAFAIMGLENYLRTFSGDSAARRAFRRLAHNLARAFEGTSADWPWPEEVLTYANARLPHALVVAGRACHAPEMIRLGLRSLDWLVRVQTADGHFAPVGNRGWYPRGGVPARFDQQPLEAECTVSACAAAFAATGEPVWLEAAVRAFQWFLGRNDLGLPLYDYTTGGCRDALQPSGLNLNEGAEATLAWLLALLEMYSLQAEGKLDEHLEQQRATEPEREMLPSRS